MEKMASARYFPEDITLADPEGKSTAAFSHNRHIAREKLKCTECHPYVFIMKVGDKVLKRGHLAMEQMEKGKYCGNCHNGEKAFSVSVKESCRRCHPR
jgi:c(7)-type cytochrome triheme protein